MHFSSGVNPSHSSVSSAHWQDILSQHASPFLCEGKSFMTSKRWLFVLFSLYYLSFNFKWSASISKRRSWLNVFRLFNRLSELLSEWNVISLFAPHVFTRDISIYLAGTLNVWIKWRTFTLVGIPKHKNGTQHNRCSECVSECTNVCSSPCVFPLANPLAAPIHFCDTQEV